MLRSTSARAITDPTQFQSQEVYEKIWIQEVLVVKHMISQRTLLLTEQWIYWITLSFFGMWGPRQTACSFGDLPGTCASGLIFLMQFFTAAYLYAFNYEHYLTTPLASWSCVEKTPKWNDGIEPHSFMSMFVSFVWYTVILYCIYKYIYITIQTTSFQKKHLKEIWIENQQKIKKGQRFHWFERIWFGKSAGLDFGHDRFPPKCHGGLYPGRFVNRRCIWRSEKTLKTRVYGILRVSLVIYVFFFDLRDETNSCWHLKMDAWNTIVSFWGV